ncbi:hypothetical protein MPSEU_000969300 [Mayamaea pseudoterrestris]|nr:hypothetical protein MPSEU_000969300 [Mayamaea pseudoterrestris]
MTFKTSDPEYQVSKDFGPDKESSWHYPKDEDAWILAHTAIRSEITAFKSALTAVNARGGIKEEWELKALQDAAAAHVEHIHLHHANEDNIVTPFILTRAKLPARLTDDHTSILKLLTSLESAFAALKVNDSVDKLLKDVTEYEANLLPHLAEEEEIGLPLMRAYFTPADVKPAYDEIVKHLSTLELGSFIVANGEDFIRSVFMKNESIPFFVWYIDFYWKARAFNKQFTYNVQALTNGEEQKKSYFWFW